MRPTGSSSPRARSPAWRGARDALALPAWVVGLSLMGVGSLARDVGQPFGVALLSSILVWAGPAQLIYFAGIGSGAALATVALAVSLSSIRLLPMTIALLPVVRRPGDGFPLQLLISHYVAATTWTEGMRRLRPLPAAERLPYFLGFGNACLVLSVLLTAIGFYLAGIVPAPLAAGLLFLTPIFFTVSIAAGARGPTDWLAFGLGFALTPVTAAIVGGGFDLMATGIVGGSVAYLAGRLRRSRP